MFHVWHLESTVKANEYCFQAHHAISNFVMEWHSKFLWCNCIFSFCVKCIVTKVCKVPKQAFLHTDQYQGEVLWVGLVKCIQKLCSMLPFTDMIGKCNVVDNFDIVYCFGQPLDCFGVQTVHMSRKCKLATVPKKYNILYFQFLIV